MSEPDARPHGLVEELTSRSSQSPNPFVEPVQPDLHRTGVSAVDDVLASMQSLAGLPVQDHVAIFEQAHDRLRRALDPRHG